MKHPILRPLALFTMSLAAAHLTAAEAAPSPKPPAPGADPSWFQEARFGLFIHWGVYAVPAGEWQGKSISGIGEWILKNGQIPLADYRAFARRFTAAKYNPEAWAALAREAGMKYVVITSKHHDGFALFDSSVSDWNAVKASAAERDLLTPLAAAVRAQGLKFGLYYSQAQDWMHPGGAISGLKEDEFGWDPAHRGSYDRYLQTIAIPQVREILTRFQPDILWWDTPTNMTAARAQPLHDLLALRPGIISNDRLGGGFAGDTRTPEQHIPPRGYPGEIFEVCMTMNDTWGFKKDDLNWKSSRELIRNLTDIASKGGNFLLNVGPDAEGSIPPASIERLLAMGRWMKVNGEAIYATTASPFPRRLPWGRVTQKREAGGATTLYLHVWDWPAAGGVLLPTLREAPAQARLLATRAAVPTRITPDGLQVLLASEATDPDVSVVELRFPGPVTVTQTATATPGTDGAIRLGALDADTHGRWTGNMTLVGSGTDAYLTAWRDAEWWVEYRVKTPRAGRWRVTAEVAAEQPVRLTLKCGSAAAPASIAATGAGTTWRTVELGTIEISAGEASLEFRAVKAGWSPLSIRNVELQPAHASDR